MVLEFVHGELAKSIHIIDKHSIEIDDLASKLKQAENSKLSSKAQVEAAVDKVADLQDNLKTVQLHIASFSEKFIKLTPLTGQVETLESKLKTINQGEYPLFCQLSGLFLKKTLLRWIHFRKH